jgi:hypothetical protein
VEEGILGAAAACTQAQVVAHTPARMVACTQVPVAVCIRVPVVSTLGRAEAYIQGQVAVFIPGAAAASTLDRGVDFTAVRAVACTQGHATSRTTAIYRLGPFLLKNSRSVE